MRIGAFGTGAHHGTIEFHPCRHEGGGMQWVRCRAWLSETHDQHGRVDELYFEESSRKYARRRCLYGRGPWSESETFVNV